MKSRFIAYQSHDPLLNLYIKTFYPKHSMDTLDLPFVCNSHKSIVDLLCDNPGLYAVLPEYSQPVFEGLRTGRLRRVLTHSLKSDLFVHYWERTQTSRKIAAFMNFLKEVDIRALFKH